MRPDPPTRPTLNAVYIAAVALDLIDREGLPKFSMRRLGRELGVDPMAVYYYFRDQDTLFDGVAEAMFDELDIESLPWGASWRELTTTTFCRMRDMLVRHPQAVTIFATHPVRSPSAIFTTGRISGVLQAAGFPPERAHQLSRCLREFTVGHALAVAVHRQGGGKRARRSAADSPGGQSLAQSDEGGEDFNLGLAALQNGFAPLTQTSP